ncbi:DUF4340 domain-containing protein [Haloferula rosea]|uniref:DUF4340 domain-containing protein n=1 Tax=Haloferula rosea TaxID=490093 RepID=A0A934RB39_9BACT|nr:DUF4340 domain-containing protein [Haloferula rosea]MBK1827378.1 DUF4340 domain-containing protein [Haloferula rosea]
MRSIFFTILLALLAFVSGSLAVMRMSEGSLARVFGLPSTPIGEELYEFDPNAVENIYLLGNGTSAHCRKTDAGWQMVAPWEDRMDPRAAQAIFGFTLNARVEGAIPSEKVESVNFGFEDGQIGFGFTDPNGDTIAKYILGHRTAWRGTDPDTAEPIPTVFVQPRDKGRKDYLYACTDPGDIHSLLKDEFKALRDHHPFLFHPTIVQSLRVKNRTGEMVLSREHPKELWSIVKPLGLKSDRAALVRLLQGLYDLEALDVKNRSEVTLPTVDPKEVEQIGLKFFGAAEEVVLEIYPPESPEADRVLAKISDRPNAVFELPLLTNASLEGGKDEVGIRDLPLSVNELRDPTLTSINHLGLKSILVSPANGEDIILQRATPKDRFSILLDGRIEEPSVLALNALIKTVTEAKVSDFVSDTATDLKPYGLDQPFLVLRFASFDGEVIQLSFGQGKDGDIHAVRDGTTTVVKVDPSMLTLIPTRPWDWRERQLWKISQPDVVGIQRQIGNEPALELGYDFVTERWTAKKEGKDLSVELVNKRADLLLNNLLDLKADAWLRPDHTAATAALKKPWLNLSLLIKEYDDEGEFAGLKNRGLVIAKVGEEGSVVYFGRVVGDENPFLLDRANAEAIAADLFEIE